jgi:hypothetical protein
MDFGTKHAKEVDLFLTLKKNGLIVYTEGWSKEFTCVSGMKITHLYPLARQTCANPMPVFPAVPSTTVPPGCNLNQCYIRTSRVRCQRLHAQAFFFGITNNTKSRSIFYATAWVLKFRFAKYMGSSALRKSFQIYLIKVIIQLESETEVRLTRGVFPTAPVKPSTPTAFVANPLVSMRFRAIENMGEGEDRPMS